MRICAKDDRPQVLIHVSPSVIEQAKEKQRVVLVNTTGRSNKASDTQTRSYLSPEM